MTTTTSNEESKYHSPATTKANPLPVTKCHLLALPRELRDQIIDCTLFDHLTDTLAAHRIASGFPPIPKAPKPLLVRLLAACAQLRAETQQRIKSLNLVTLWTSNTCCGDHTTHWIVPPVTQVNYTKPMYAESSISFRITMDGYNCIHIDVEEMRRRLQERVRLLNNRQLTKGEIRVNFKQPGDACM
jgi:hypothetical protein